MNPGDWNEWSRHVLAELKRLDRANEHLHSKFDKLHLSLDKYNEILVRNTASLEEHMRRTNLLESRLEKVDQEVDGLSAHIDRVKSIMNFVSSLFSLKSRFIVKLICSGVVLLLSYHLGLKDLVAWLLK